MGSFSGFPYIPALDEKINLFTPLFTIASSITTGLTKLLVKYLPGSKTDSPAWMYPAKCSIALTSLPPNTLSQTPLSPTSPFTNSSPSGKDFSLELSNKSMTTTLSPRPTNLLTTWLPIYPAPPVTTTFIIQIVSDRQNGGQVCQQTARRPDAGSDQAVRALLCTHRNANNITPNNLVAFFSC